MGFAVFLDILGIMQLVILIIYCSTDILDNDTIDEKVIALKKYRTTYNLLADWPGNVVLIVKVMLGLHWLCRRERILFIKYYRVSMTYIMHTLSLFILNLVYLKWSQEKWSDVLGSFVFLFTGALCLQIHIRYLD